VTPKQLGWVSGIFEGEGCLSLQKSGGWLLSVASTDFDTILMLWAVTGVGRINPLVVKPHCKPAWSWRVSRREQVIALVTMLRPLMMSRRSDKFGEALDWYAAHPRRQAAPLPFQRRGAAASSSS
jgi:hypothetical protein